MEYVAAPVGLTLKEPGVKACHRGLGVGRGDGLTKEERSNTDCAYTLPKTALT